MKTFNSALFAGFLFATGLIALPLKAQNFTFTTIAGGSQGSNDGVGSSAQFFQPTGVAADGAGNVYVADQANDAIREISPSGTNWIVATIAGGAQGSLDGTNTAAQFSSPTGIALDSATNLYVADQFNHTIRKITPIGTNWVVSTIAGQVRVSGTNDGANFNSQFHNPTGIAVDGADNVFVADEFNNAIRKITPVGTNWIVSTIAGGSNGAANGTNAAAQFNYPAGVAVDSNNRVYVADQFNNTIRLITPTGTNWVVTTIAGQLNAGAGNGLGTNAQFDTPVGVALDANDNVYVADLFNNAIREMTQTNANWLVSTIGGGGKGVENGTGTNARFYLPFGVATDVFGDIFVADSGNNAIRLGRSSSGAPQTGGVAVTLMPSNAVAAGAQWQLDGGPLQGSGALLSGLAPGDHILTFSTVSGFTTPADQSVTVTAHQTMRAMGDYVTAIASAGSLQVQISPEAVVMAGAQWQVDSGPFQTNGAIVAGLSIGSHTLSFNAISGWTAPDAQTIAISNSQTTLGLGTYLLQVSNYTITLSASPANSGTVAGGGTFQDGDLQTVTSTANNGYIFTNWTLDGNVASLSTNYTFTIGGNEMLVANFLPACMLSVSASPDNEGTASAGGTVFPIDSSPIAAAVPNIDFEFIGWTGDATGTSNPLVVAMNTNLSITANFAPAGSMTLTIVTNGDGAVSPNLSGKDLKAGRSYVLIANGRSGSVFSNWTGSLTTNRNPLTVKMFSVLASAFS